MKKDNHLNLKILLSFLVSSLIIILVMYPIVLPVEESLEGVELSLADENYLLPVKVKLSGEYEWKLFGEDRLALWLQTEGNLNTELILGFAVSDLQQGVSYGKVGLDGAQVSSYMLWGNLRYSPVEKREELVILYPIGATQWTKETGRCLVFPATDRASALRILEKYDREAYAAFAGEAEGKAGFLPIR